MGRKPKDPNADLMHAMRRAIMDVLNNPNAEVVEKVKAIEAGSKLLAAEAKLNQRDTSSGSYFARS